MRLLPKPPNARLQASSPTLGPITMSAKHLERQNRYVERLKAEGLKRFQFWMKPEEKEYLMKVLENMREGRIIDSSDDKPSSIQQYSNDSGHDKERLIRLIKNGQYSNISRNPSPPYFHDLLNTPERFWDKPLPDAIIVVADKHVRVKKWRAISLKGLGAFPVVWTIIGALNRHVFQEMARTSPRRRTFNLLEYDFESIVEMIVGRASMRANDCLRGTPMGFITFPVEVATLLVDPTISENSPQGVLTVIIDARGRLKQTNAHCEYLEQITNWRIGIPPLEADIEMREGWNPYMLALYELFKR